MSASTGNDPACFGNRAAAAIEVDVAVGTDVDAREPAAIDGASNRKQSLLDVMQGFRDDGCPDGASPIFVGGAGR